jgi:hypothetical protein
VQPDLPPGRYDPPSRRGRILTGILAAVVALAALLGGYALYSRHNAGVLDAELTSYKVTSDSSVRIEIQVVTRGHDGQCQVRARDRYGDEAGSEIVPVTSNGKRTQLVTVDLKTKARPVNGELVGCQRVSP